MKYIVLISIIAPLFSNAQQVQSNVEQQINFILDDWHKAVAEYDSKRYFGYMTKTGRFLGTDESERWTKEEFMNFSKPHFEKRKTWDFKPSKRKLFVSEDGKYAWFDEILDTWMGTCRGSGILRLMDNEWKIEQYNLAVLIPNTKINEYLDIIGKPKKQMDDGQN